MMYIRCMTDVHIVYNPCVRLLDHTTVQGHSGHDERAHTAVVYKSRTNIHKEPSMRPRPDLFFGELRALLHHSSPEGSDWRRLRARLQRAWHPSASGARSAEALTHAIDYARQVIHTSSGWEELLPANPIAWSGPLASAEARRALSLCQQLRLFPGALQRDAWKAHIDLARVRRLDVTLYEEEDGAFLSALLEDLPALESLSIKGQGTVMAHEELAELFTGDGPALRALELVDVSLYPELIDDLLTAPFLSRIERLGFARCAMSDELLLMCCEGLSREHVLKALDLSCNAISRGGLLALAQSEASARLEELTLTLNDLRDFDLTALQDAPFSETLRHLAIDYNELGLESLELLCQLDLPELVSLDLSGLEPSPAIGLSPLSHAAFLPRLQTLRVAGDELTAPDTWARLFDAATSLTHLDLAGCLPGEEGFEALSRRLCSGQFEELVLDTYSPEHVPETFFEELFTEGDLSKLHTLSLRGHHLDATLLEASTPSRLNLKTLRLAGSHVSSHGVAHLISCIEPFTLEELELSRMPDLEPLPELLEAIGQQAIATLCLQRMTPTDAARAERLLTGVVRACAPTLERLDLSHQALSQSFFEALSFGSLTTMTHLSCHDTAATASSLEVLLDAASDHFPHLMELDWRGNQIDPDDWLLEELPLFLSVITTT